MAAPFDSYSLLQPDPQYSPRRLPFESNSYSINGYNGMNATYSRNLRQEDDESAMIDPSSPASSSCSDGKPVLRGVASRKVIIHSPQARSYSAVFPHSRMPKTRISSSNESASNIESPNFILPPNQSNRSQSWPRVPLSCENCDISLLAPTIEESQFDAYSDDDPGESGMPLEQRLGKLKRFGRRMSNVFRHLCRA